MAKVLLYRLGEDTEKGRRVRALLRTLRMRAVDIAPGELLQTAGHLAGEKDCPASGEAFTGNAPELEFMLLCGLSGSRLDALLSALKRQELRVPYKAVLTRHNRSWTLLRLMEEVRLERSALFRAEPGVPGTTLLTGGHAAAPQEAKKEAPVYAVTRLKVPVKLPWEK